MTNLSYISDANALKKITLEEDRQFLPAQQEPGRRGFMSTVDKISTQKENRKMKREEKSRLYKKKIHQTYLKRFL